MGRVDGWMGLVIIGLLRAPSVLIRAIFSNFGQWGKVILGSCNRYICFNFENNFFCKVQIMSNSREYCEILFSLIFCIFLQLFLLLTAFVREMPIKGRNGKTKLVASFITSS